MPQSDDAPSAWAGLRPYVRIARPDNWFKNVFVLPGAIVAQQLTSVPFQAFWKELLMGLFATCLIASANYSINEWLDRDSDRFHPVKKSRPSVAGSLRARWVYFEYVALAAIALLVAWRISLSFLITSAVFLLMGFLYNVRPFRTKERVYLDVLSESINNPIRLLLGWFIVTGPPLPPGSLLVSYWMGGAYLMGVKRFSELRFLGDPVVAAQYRRSFRFYTEDKLLISSLFYGLLSASLGAVFLVKYRLELVFALPLVCLVFAWYFAIGLKPDSAAQHPERMYGEARFSLFVAFVALVIFFCFKIDLPMLRVLLRGAFLKSSQ